MRLLKFFAMLSVLLISSAYSRAQVSIGIGIGGYSVPAYIYGPPTCAYGYYNYEPYACAPYGYYGPRWSRLGYYVREYYGRGYGYRGYDREGYERGREVYDREDYGREGYGRGYEGHGHGRGGRGYAGGYARGGGRGRGRR